MRLSVAAAAACLSIVGVAAADQAAAAIKKFTDIPAQELGSALQTLAQDRDFQVVYLSDAVDKLKTSGAVGEFTADEALKRLLKGTGLSYRYLDEKTITVLPTRGESATNSKDSADVRVKAEGDGAAAVDGAGESGDSEGGKDKAIWDRFRIAQSDGTSSSFNSPSPSQGNVKGEDKDTISEIIVTAQKREERALEVPGGLSVISGATLERTEAQSLYDLNGFFPSLTVASEGSPGKSPLIIRGISTNTGGVASLVGIYIDDTPVTTSSGAVHGNDYSADLVPYDLNRIEVLDGPQGTLYGASAMGGVLKYSLKDPTLHGDSFRLGGIVNTVDHSGEAGGGFRGAADVTLEEGVLGLRMSGYEQRTKGFIDDVGTDTKDAGSYTQYGGRIVALWKPNDLFSLKLSGFFQHIDDNEASTITVDPLSLKPLFGDYKRFSNVPDPYQEDNQVYSLTATWDLEPATLTSVSSYQHWHMSQSTDFTNNFQSVVATVTDGAVTDSKLSFPRIQTLDKYTEEVRLASKEEGMLRWMLGAFYTRESSVQTQTVYAYSSSGQLLPNLNPFFLGDIPKWIYDEAAVFANGAVHLNEHFVLNAGVRYSHNWQDTLDTTYGALFGTFSPTSYDEFKSNQGVTTWMVSPQWFFDNDHMLYARVATGYRPGGWSYATPPAATTFQADTLTNYELGYKGSWIERLTAEFSVYDIEWNDIQINVQDPVTKIISLGNGKTARSRGVETTVNYRLDNGLTLGAASSYNDARLTADAPGVGGLKGDRLPLSPRFTGALSAEYTRPIASDASLYTGVTYRYLSDIWNVLPHAYQAFLTRQGDPFDVHVGVDIKNFDLRLYVRNVFDAQSKITKVANTADFAVADSLSFVPIQPRTVGLSVDKSF